MGWSTTIKNRAGDLLEETPLYPPVESGFVWTRGKYARLYRRYKWWRKHRHSESVDDSTGNRTSTRNGLNANSNIIHSSKNSQLHSAVDGEEFELSPPASVDNPVIGPEDIPDAIASYVADPFVVRDDDTFHMFFEVKDVAGDAFIAHAESEDGYSFSYDQIVIPPSEAQHSYPYVFQHEGEWYMTPSSMKEIAGQFRIYRAENFPHDWTPVDVPLEDKVRIDPTPFYFDDTWYVIFQEVDTYDTVLWYADELIGGEWTEHPASPIFSPRNDHPEFGGTDIDSLEWGDPRSPDHLPIVEDVPSGRPIVRGDSVDVFYRRTTEGVMRHFRIDELSKTTFSHHEVADSPILRGTGADDWNGHMMHTFNVIRSGDPERDIAVVDGLELKEYVWRIGIYDIEAE